MRCGELWALRPRNHSPGGSQILNDSLNEAEGCTQRTCLVCRWLKPMLISVAMICCSQTVSQVRMQRRSTCPHFRRAHTCFLHTWSYSCGGRRGLRELSSRLQGVVVSGTHSHARPSSRMPDLCFPNDTCALTSIGDIGALCLSVLWSVRSRGPSSASDDSQQRAHRRLE